jgi:uncharacterized protein (TIGR00251 family)
MFYSREEGMIRLRIKAQPGAGRSEIVGIYGEEALKVRIAAAAVEGAANRELVRFLSKYFRIPKSEIRFRSGETAKIKVLEFPETERFRQFMDELLK